MDNTDPRLQGDSGLDMIDDENNEGELLLATAAIQRAVKRGMPLEKARRTFGIRGHPAFKDLWPETKFWGDAAWARELRYGKGPDDD
jgi:hypothetical protein